MQRPRRIAGAAVFVLLGAALGAAAATPDEIIAKRQDGYAHMGDITKAMKEAIESGADIRPFAPRAQEIADWARTIPTLFPPGTEHGHKTKARSEIWSDRAGFEAASAKLPPAAEKLAAIAAGGDKAAFADQFKAMGATCGGCHRAYRYRDD